MQENIDDTTDDELTEISATVSVDAVVKALKLNATHGVDDRVLAVPQRDGAEASIRPAFRGTERYSNPSQAPIHVRPKTLVEDPWSRPPRRDQVDVTSLDIPERVADRTDADSERLDEAHDELLDDWETDVRGMIEGEHNIELKGCDVTLVGTDN